MPCDDEIDVDGTAEFHISDSSKEHSDNHQEDLCSPFCSCQCCHVDVVDLDLYPYELILPISSKLHNSGVVNSTQEVNYSFLRPPRA